MALDPKSSGTAAVEDFALSPNQKYWDLGLKVFNNGQPSTSAIQVIWQNMFPASLDLVAQIVGALYGDTYFDPKTMRMNPQSLADDISAAIGSNPADCLRSAQKAFSQWYGLSVRSNFQDNALIPRSGSIMGSPDVVVNGKTELTPQQLIGQWNQTIWGPISGDRNLAYGRAASVNLPLPIAQPVMKMFIVEAAINPPNPQSWVQIFTASGGRTSPLVNNTGAGTLSPGDRAANSDAFIWTVPGSGHYCVISVAGSEYFTNDPAQVPPGNWNSTAWITFNGSAGWHNLNTPTANFAVLKVHNQDASPERFQIEAVCSKLEPGTNVSLELADASLGAGKRSVRIASDRDHVVTLDTILPPNYSGDVKVSFDTPDGGAIPEESSIDVRSHWVVPPGHARFEDAVDRVGDTRAHALGRHVRLYAGNFTLVGKI